MKIFKPCLFFIALIINYFFFCLFAWGTEPIVVAVIDSGVDVNHNELKSSLWTNPGEVGLDQFGNDKSTNGIDDDQNGYVDDLHGWDFVLNLPAQTDPLGHGTHMAGIISAEGKNPKLKKAIGFGSKIMSIRYYQVGSSGTENLKNSVAAFQYAIKMGADVINYSGGGPSPDPSEQEALISASRKNILVIAAAGNEGRNIDQKGFYPAAYELSNILSVAAVGPDDQPSNTSNFGLKTVQIAAPGENILSCLPGNKIGRMTGTSQATAFVTGAAARLLIRWNHLRKNPQRVIELLVANANWQPSLSKKIKNSAVLKDGISSFSLGLDIDAFGKPLPSNQLFKPLKLAL